MALCSRQGSRSPSNINYDLLQKYLDWMEVRHLITYEVREGHEMVALAPNGREAYRKIALAVNEVLRSR